MIRPTVSQSILPSRQIVVLSAFVNSQQLARRGRLGVTPSRPEYRQHPYRRATTSRSDLAPPQARDQQRQRVPDDRSDPEGPAHAAKVSAGPPTSIPGPPKKACPTFPDAHQSDPNG